MDILVLHLRDFLGHKDTAFTMAAAIQVFVGPNGAGKSSILDALNYLLLGEPLRADLKKKDHAALIRDGAKKAELELSTPTLTIKRSITATQRTLIVEKDGAPLLLQPDKLQQAILDEIGVTEEALRTVLDSERFLDLPAPDRKTLLFGLAKEPLTETTIAARLAEKLSDDVREGQEGVIEGAARVAATEGFEAAEKRAVERRRQAKRDLEQARDNLRDAPSETFTTSAGKLVQLGTIEPKALAEKARTLTAERDELVESRGRAKASRDVAERAEARLKSVEARLEDLPDPKNEGSPEEAEAVLKDLEARKAKAGEAVERARRGYAEAGAERQAIPKDPPEPAKACETCQRPFDIESRATAMKEWERKLADLKAKRERADEAIRLTREDLEKAERALAAAETELSAAQTKLGKVKIHAGVREDLEREKRDLEAQLQAFKKSAEAGPQPETEGRIAELGEKITHAQEILEALKRYRQDVGGREGAQKAERLAEQQVALYDALQKALAPAGIPADVAGETVVPVQRAVGALSQGLGLGVALDADGEVLVNGRAHALASESERLRAGILIQAAIARVAGVRLLLVDRVAVLDPEGRKALIKTVAHLLSFFDRIMLFQTLGENGVKVSRNPQVATWVIEDGEVELLKAEAA